MRALVKLRCHACYLKSIDIGDVGMLTKCVRIAMSDSRVPQVRKPLLSPFPAISGLTSKPLTLRFEERQAPGIIERMP